MKKLIIILAVLYSSLLWGQPVRVLFLGNSYTSVNNLPQMVADVAASTGDALVFDSNTPGGCTLQQHSVSSASLGKIAAGNWDYVVLQEQSQRPSYPINQVMTLVFPYAQLLDSLINASNTGVETVFYMTWGRKNGDASNCAAWPPVCTYEGMDSLLNLRYRMMTDSNEAVLSPVGAVWHYIREHYPLIELYQADESHPSVAGTYAAACSFYAAFFRKDPTQVTFNPGLPTGDADNIRNAAKLVVYDSLLTWHIGEYDTVTVSVSPGRDTSCWSICPNPASSYVSIINSPGGTLSYRISNMHGREIQAGTLNNSDNRIVITGLIGGLYFLQLSDGKKSLGWKKFVKNLKSAPSNQ